ncbi:hypothetical protein AB0B31_23390 [Catellatospora citrea]|uniref:hypothetical protein n=1 Tax=Catellatospora citrea TaxID=53366 RepID=UPI0034000505
MSDAAQNGYPAAGRVPAPASGKRRTWTAAIAVLLIVAALIVLVVTRLHDEGPLEGDDGLAVTIPARPGDTGVAWGNLELYNHSGAVIVLDRIETVHGRGDLVLIREPYIWGPDRLAIANSRSLVAYQMPLPTEWASIPEHPVKGYEIPPMPADAPAGSEQAIGPEIVIEVGPPTQAASIDKIRVHYHVDGRSYVKEFDNSLTVCPARGQKPGCG